MRLKFKILILLSIFLLGLLFPAIIESEAEPSAEVTWTWNYGKTLYRGNMTSFAITLRNNLPVPIKISNIGLHTAWMPSNAFVFTGSMYELKSGESHAFTFSETVPSDASLGETADFACIVYYDNFTSDSGVIRAPLIEIKEGAGVYVEQHINPLHPILIMVLGLGVIIPVYYFRERVGFNLKKVSKYASLIVFTLSLLIFLVSVHSNFSPWYASNPFTQGFSITGDEPHYVFIIKALLKGDLNTGHIYPEGYTQHYIDGKGLFTEGMRIPAHSIGFPVLLILPYLFGKFILHSGVYGALIFNCLLASGIITLIYKISVYLSKDISTGLITSLTFALSTLLFPWAGQLFPEIAIGFVVLYVTFKVLVSPTKSGWALVGIVLGLFPFLKPHTIFFSAISLIAITTFLFKRREEFKCFLISFVAGLSVYVFYVVGVLGVDNFFLLTSSFAESAVSSPSAINILGVHISSCFWLGLLGHWIDSNSGLLFYSPILILSFLGLLAFIKKSKRLFAIFVLVVFSVWYFATGILGIWHGWLSIPARYMICVLPLLSIPLTYGIMKFGRSLIFRAGYISLFLIGLIPNCLIAFNRLLGYTIVWSQGVPRSRYVLGMGRAFGFDISFLPDFAFAWYHGGEIGNIPQSPALLISWAFVFLLSSIFLLYVGYSGGGVFCRLRERLREVISFKFHFKEVEV